jgi:sulfatase maturation enzyme AslB (radical SAM superfamily)
MKNLISHRAKAAGIARSICKSGPTGDIIKLIVLLYWGKDMTGLSDSFQRPINYLRVAVTDRCNLRCVYCMPEEGVFFIPHSDI